MKMKTIIKLLFVFSLPFIFCRCADDGIHYEREINVPERYLSDGECVPILGRGNQW